MKDIIERSVKRSKRNVPEDSPPISNIGNKLMFIFFIIGLLLSIFVDLIYFPIIITITLTGMMIDTSRQLNKILRKEGQVAADYVFGLAIGGFIILISTYIFFTLSSIANNLILAGMISTLTFFIYEYLLLIIIRINIDTEEVHVKKHPRKPLDRYYIFTEEEYIKLVEEAALDGEFKDYK